MKIGKLELDKGKVFVIAEIGNNHNGSYERAIELVDKVVESGADCAKFQMRDLTEVYRSKTLAKTGDDLSAEYTIDLLKKFELSLEEQKKLKEYCESKGVMYMCTPWDKNSLKTLEDMGVEAYKVASADFTNLPLINAIIETNKPVILSTGMSTETEIKDVVAHLNEKKANFCILHCNSTYPAPFHSINLKYLESLKKIHNYVGYSGHERGIAVSLGAVALGATVIERHITLDRDMEGPDHAASLEPGHFKALVDGIRELEEALGEGGVKQVSQGEMINRENLSKSLIANKKLEKGHVITEADIDVKSPGLGLSPRFLEDLVGKTLTRSMDEEDYFYASDISGKSYESKKYTFNRPWGIPVRYHDFDVFKGMVNAPLVEFHLSYNDMDLNLDDYFQGTYDIEFVVHAPELFAGSRLMDLATPDDDYREYSIKETQRVIDITRDLKRFFPKTERPLIVANIGGFSRDGNIPENLKEEYYERFNESLKQLNTEGVEIIPQTMAPFPWHFGGQRYQNLFVMADEIVERCKKYNLRLCLDISHSRLTTNHFNLDFYDFLEKVGPYVAHLHLGDSKGVDGEGLQIGDGDIDFKKTAEILNRTCPEASFIPEIWQGHKNNGEGFWIALERLEPVF